MKEKESRIGKKSPIIFIIENKTNAPQKIGLFSENLLKNRNIIVQCGSSVIGNVTYKQILDQINAQSFETSLIRVQSENYKQNNEPIQVEWKEGALVCSAYVDRKKQTVSTHLQEGIIDIEYCATLDENTTLYTTILPNSKIQYTFFN